ncbi:MAG: ATP-binding protein [Promethearchaeota archaeon]
MINRDYFDFYLILELKGFKIFEDNIIEKMESAIIQLKTAIAAEINYELEELLGHQLERAIGDLLRLGNGGSKRFKIKKATTYNGITIFSDSKDYFSILKFDFSKYFTSGFNIKKNYMLYFNKFLENLMKEDISIRYIFNLNFKSAFIGEMYDFKDIQRLSNKFEIDQNIDTKNDWLRKISYKPELYLDNIKLFGGIIIFSDDLSKIKRDINRTIGIINSIWKIPLTSVKNEKRSKAILYRFDFYEFFLDFHSSRDLCVFNQFPTILSRNQEKKFELKVDIPPESVCNQGKLNIGKIIENNQPTRDFFLKLEDLKKHVFINGSTGTGKSSFIQNLLFEINSKFSGIPFLLIELKGEYTWFKEFFPNIEILEPGINFGINIFDPGESNPRIHSERLYEILKSSLNFSSFKEFSPQMEKILVDLIYQTCTDPDPNSRDFNAFFQNAKNYILDNKDKIPFLESSWIAIENRLRRISTGPLRCLFDESINKYCIIELFKKQVIINLNSIIKLGGSKEDIYFFANMIFKYLWDYNLSKGPKRAIEHITIIEDVQYISKKIDKKNAFISTYFEDIALIQRGTGEVLISISTRPDISQDVLSNCGLVVCFQTKIREDIKKLLSLLHLDDDKRELLEILPEHVALIKVNSYPYPFLLRSKLLFKNKIVNDLKLEEPEIKSPGYSLKNNDRGRFKFKISNVFKIQGQKKKKKKFLKPIKFNELILSGNKKSIEIKRRFIEKLAQYYMVQEKVWNHFDLWTRERIIKENQKINKIKNELLVLIRNHEEINFIFKNANKIKPRILNLIKFKKEVGDLMA